MLEPEAAITALRAYWPHLGRIDDTSLGRRHLCEPAGDLLRPRGLTELTAAYRRHALRLAGRAASAALERAGLRGRDVDLVVTVSCTGYLVPSLDVLLAPELGLRTDVIRAPLTELGCSGGAAAIALAHRHLLAFPGHVALVIAVELPSLSFHEGDRSADNLTASLVFGDGAGAAVMGDGSTGLQVLRTASHLVPGTASLLGFDLRDGGFHVVLDRRLSRVLARELEPAISAFLPEPDFLAVHAGGPRILDAVESALGLAPDRLSLSREVFEAVGNTSSASILFVLERLLQCPGGDGEEGLALGIGPGVSIELMHLVRRRGG